MNENLLPRILWWDCGCCFDCVCGAKEFTLLDEDPVTCDQCGRVWTLSTELRCTAPSNNGFHADRASGPDNSEHSPETRPAGEP